MVPRSRPRPITRPSGAPEAAGQRGSPRTVYGRATASRAAAAGSLPSTRSGGTTALPPTPQPPTATRDTGDTGSRQIGDIWNRLDLFYTYWLNEAITQHNHKL